MADYRRLMEQGEYEAAGALLEGVVAETDDDDARRALARCQVESGQVEDAVATILQLSTLEREDHRLLVTAYGDLCDWNAMASVLRTLGQLEESAFVYYHMALATAQDRPYWELDSASRQVMVNHLSRAIALEECCPDAFFLLANLLRASDRVDDSIVVLRACVTAHPDDVEVLCRLSLALMVWVEDYQAVVDVLTPACAGTADPRVVWDHMIALIHLGRFDEAVADLESLALDSPVVEASIRADILVRKGELGAWLAACELYDDVGSVDGQMRMHLRRAFVNLSNGDLAHALTDFRQGMRKSFRNSSDLGLFESIEIGGHLLRYETFDYMQELVDSLVLYAADGQVTGETFGFVLWAFWHWYGHLEEKEQEIRELLGLETGDIPRLAADLLGNPPMLGDRLCGWLAANDLPQAIAHRLAYALWAWDSDRKQVGGIDKHRFRHCQESVETQKESKKEDIHAVAMEYLRANGTNEIIQAIFLPFYDTFWRDVLFKGGLFEEVVDVSRIFVAATEGEHGVFDLAYGLNEVGSREEAAILYRELLAREPRHASAMNNLAVILEEQGQLEEARDLFEQALALAPSSTLYQSNLDRVTRSLDRRQRALGARQAAREKVLAKAREAGLGAQEVEQLSSLYWSGDVPATELRARFGVHHIYKYVFATDAGESCPNCGIELVYTSRQKRQRREVTCFGCDHTGGRWCRCAYCQLQAEKRAQRRAARRREQEMAAFQRLREQYGTAEYAEWAVAKLTRRERQFLRAFIDVVTESGETTWEAICERAAVVSQKPYVKRLTSLKLLFATPDGELVSNTAVTAHMLDVPTVRRISKSLRFNVFQRDNHTCQYCGRKPPDVVLQIDHLVPVAKGGTDDFENLVTSCEDCNAGKSDKIVEVYTGGHTRDEWREEIRAARAAVMRDRRERIPEVVEHWQTCVGREKLQQGEEDAIHSFLERYDPDWIKAAISITARKKVKNQVTYTAGILRNWGKTGPPEYLSDPEGYWDKKPATPAQVTFIQGLLGRLGLDLSECYHKTEYDDLTMEDARNLIQALTERSGSPPEAEAHGAEMARPEE
jgi:tetratricopeptide (TPR) repeat protein